MLMYYDERIFFNHKQNMSNMPTRQFSYVAKGLFFLAAALFLVWFALQPSWFKNVKAEVTQQPYARTITIQGEGEVNAKPDIAMVSLSVVSEKKTVKEVTADGNEKMNKVVEVVKGLGVSADDIKTTQYSLYPNYFYPERSPGKAIIDGYKLDQTLSVKVRDLAKVEDIVDKAVVAGSNQIGGLSFEIDDDSSLRADARAEAFKDARAKAESMASAAGVNLGRVITFSEDSGGFYPQPYYAKASMDMAVEEVAYVPAIEVGSQDIKVTMSVTYEIE